MNALRIDARFDRQLSHESFDETEVVNGGVRGTAGAHVPIVVDPLREGHDESFPIGKCFEPRTGYFPRSWKPYRVKVNNQRYWSVPRVARRNMQQVRASRAIDNDVALQVAGRQRDCWTQKIAFAAITGVTPII
jgi:hypothetical protein